jgi:hypothetical protein
MMRGIRAIVLITAFVVAGGMAFAERASIDLAKGGADAHLTFAQADSDKEFISAETIAVGDINGDSSGDLIIRGRYMGAPVIGVMWGRAELPKQKLLLPVPEVLDVLIYLQGEPSVFFPEMPPVVGDINGDRIGDLVIPVEDGFVVFWGRTKWPARIDMKEMGADLKIVAPLSRQRGESWLGLASIGDVNGDGIDDLLLTHRPLPPPVQAKPHPSPSSYEKVGSLVFGRKEWPRSINFSKEFPDVTINAEVGDPSLRRLRSLRVGDVDGDGYGDILVGPWEGVLGKGGVVATVRDRWATGWVIPGAQKLTSTIILRYPSDKITSPVRKIPAPVFLDFRHDGWALEGGIEFGDIDGDGKADVILSMIQAGSGDKAPHRKICLLKGGEHFFAETTRASVKSCAMLGGDRFDGFSPAQIYWPMVGDFNGDGRKDIVMRGHDHKYSVVYGRPLQGTVDIESVQDVEILPPSNTRGFGFQTALGDVNGDQKADLLILQTTGNPPGVYIVHGR